MARRSYDDSGATVGYLPDVASAGAERQQPRAIGVPGILVVTLGVVLILIAFTTQNWYAASSHVDSAGDVGFAELHRLASVSGGGLSRAYFGWLAWVLILAAIVVGFLANVPSPASIGLRAVGLLLGLIGAAGTYAALHGVVPGGDVFHNADAGIWLAVVGYLVTGVGAALGPRRLPPPPPHRPRPF